MNSSSSSCCSSDTNCEIHSCTSCTYDHYASIMFRASYKYRDAAATPRSETVIVKTLPEADTEKARNLGGYPLFATEVRLYTRVLPQLEAMWQSCGESVRFAGSLLHAALQPHPVIVLQDLCLSGYDILRGRLFDRDEVKACLGKLAMWHAVSHKMAFETPQRADVTQLQHGLLNSAIMQNSDYMRHGMRSMIAALERAGGFEALLPRLRAIEPGLISRCLALNDAYASGVQGPIYALNHGDFHTKNIMVCATERGTLADMLFIDFQLCFFGSITYDLLYSSYTLLSREFREQHRDEFHSDYFQHFVQSLQQLQFTGRIPSYDDFKADYKRWSCFELYLVATFLPLTFKLSTRPEDAVDINLIFDSAEYRQRYYNNPEYIACLRELLPRFQQEGYLD